MQNTLGTRCQSSRKGLDPELCYKNIKYNKKSHKEMIISFKLLEIKWKLGRGCAGLVMNLNHHSELITE